MLSERAPKSAVFQIFKLFSDAARTFNELSVLQSSCTLVHSSEAQVFVRELAQQARAVTIPHVGNCRFKRNPKFELRCPYVDDRTEIWLKELAAQSGAGMSFYNPAEEGPLSTPPASRVLR